MTRRTYPNRSRCSSADAHETRSIENLSLGARPDRAHVSRESHAETPRPPAVTSRCNHMQNREADPIIAEKANALRRPPSRINSGLSHDELFCGAGRAEPLRGIRCLVNREPAMQEVRGPIRGTELGFTSVSRDHANSGSRH